MAKFYVYESYSVRCSYRKTVEAESAEAALAMATTYDDDNDGWAGIEAKEEGPFLGDVVSDAEYEVEPAEKESFEGEDV